MTIFDLMIANEIHLWYDSNASVWIAEAIHNSISLQTRGETPNIAVQNMVKLIIKQNKLEVPLFETEKYSIIRDVSYYDLFAVLKKNTSNNFLQTPHFETLADAKAFVLLLEKAR